MLPMCRVVSCVVGRGCLLWPVCSHGKTLLALPLLHFVLQGQICMLLQISLDFLIFHSSRLWWKRYLFNLLEGILCLHRTIQLHLLQHSWLGHRFAFLFYYFFFSFSSADISSELSRMAQPSWVALHEMTHSCIALHKAVVHVISLISFPWLWFSFCLTSDG